MTQNPYQRRRLGSVMGGPPKPSPTFRGGGTMPQAPVQPPPQQDSNSQYFDEIMRMRNNPGPGSAAYRSALNEMPTPEEYKPNWMTRIAAGLSGFGAGYKDPASGVETARSVNEAPYRSALEQYGNRLGTLKEGADLEQQETESTLKTMSEARALGLKYDEFKLKRDNEFADNERADLLAGSTVNRNTAYADSLKKKKFGQVAVEGGTQYVDDSDPTNNFTVRGETIGTGNLNVARTNARTNQTNATTNQTNAQTSRNTSDANVQNVYNQMENRDANTLIAGGNAETNARRANDSSRNIDSLIKSRADRTTGRPVAPTQQKAAYDQALRQLYTDPEFRNYITQSTNGYFDAADPNDFDDDQEGYSEFTEALEATVEEILRRGAR